MKKVIFIIIGVIVLAYIVGVFSTQKLYTEIDIDASPEIVWSELTNFEQYSEWNPFIKQISGELSVGSQLAVTVHPPGGNAMSFEPKVLTVNKNKELRWRGRVLLPKLFDGEHFFKIEETDGKVHFIHGENFSGILALLLWGSMEAETKQGFLEMNKSLKTRCEAIYNQVSETSEDIQLVIRVYDDFFLASQ